MENCLYTFCSFLTHKAPSKETWLSLTLSDVPVCGFDLEYNPSLSRTSNSLQVNWRHFSTWSVVSNQTLIILKTNITQTTEPIFTCSLNQWHKGGMNEGKILCKEVFNVYARLTTHLQDRQGEVFRVFLLMAQVTWPSVTCCYTMVSHFWHALGSIIFPWFIRKLYFWKIQSILTWYFRSNYVVFGHKMELDSGTG